MEGILRELFANGQHSFIFAFGRYMRYQSFSQRSHYLCYLMCKKFLSWLCFCHQCRKVSRLGEVIASFITKYSQQVPGCRVRTRNWSGNCRYLFRKKKNKKKSYLLVVMAVTKTETSIFIF